MARETAQAIYAPSEVMRALHRNGVKLTHLQRDALRIALAPRRGPRAMTGAQRYGLYGAMAILRRSFPTAQAVKLALRDETYAAQVMADAALIETRKRATIGARGSHLGGRSDACAPTKPTLSARVKRASRWVPMPLARALQMWARI